MTNLNQNDKANLLAEMLDANRNANSINLKGKDYVTVQERIKAFRKVYPFGSIVTEIISVTEKSCLIKATIYNDQGACLANAHALEDRNSTPVNKLRYIENCETSAIGRALGHCGFGDPNVSSEEEANSQPQTQDSVLPRPSEEELRGAYATVISSYETQKINNKPFGEVVPAFGSNQRQIAFLKKYFITTDEVTSEEKEAAKIIIAALSQND